MKWGRKGLGGSSEEMDSTGAELEYWLEELVYLVCVQCACVSMCVCVCVHGVCSIALNSNVTPAAPTAFVAARLFHDCAKVSCTHEAAAGRTEDGRRVGRIFNVGNLRRNS